MATIREIAKRVGFSQATVSRVLKDDPTFSVKDSTREKILNASLEMGYKNVPQYQRITIPQDVAILDNVVPDKGLRTRISTSCAKCSSSMPKSSV